MKKNQLNSKLICPFIRWVLLIAFILSSIFSFSYGTVGTSDTNSESPPSLQLNLLFSTFFSSIKPSSPPSIAVDAAGNIYITGTTSSPNFPKKNAYNSTYNGGVSEIFFAKFNRTGNLIYSTFLDGIVGPISIAVNSFGYCYMTGEALDNGFTA